MTCQTISDMGPLRGVFIPGSPVAIRRLSSLLILLLLLCGLEVFSSAAKITEVGGKVELKRQGSQNWDRVEGAETVLTDDGPADIDTSEVS